MRCPKAETFVEMFRTKLQSLVWSNLRSGVRDAWSQVKYGAALLVDPGGGGGLPYETDGDARRLA